MATAAAKNELAAQKTAGHTEAVTYRPGSGRVRQIDAMVDREGVSEGRAVGRPRMRVTAVNDAIQGIDAMTLDTGTDEIDVAKMPGAAATARRVQQVMGVDADWVTVEVA